MMFLVLTRADAAIASTTNAQGASESDSSAFEESPAHPSILAELERIQASRYFRGSTRGKQFLTYVVQNALDGRTEMLKERVIGTELFNKPPDYATGEEPVVRVQAGEVRRRLHDYYLSGPSEARVLIELPTGSYTPTFRWLPKTFRDAPSPAPSPLIVPSRAEAEHGTEEESHGGAGPSPRSLLPWGIALLSFGIAVICALFAFSPRLFHRRTELDQFWAPSLQSKNPVLICVGQPVVYLPRPEAFERYAATHPGEFGSEVQRLTEVLPFAPNEELKWKDLYAVDDFGVAVGDVYAAVQLSRLLDAQARTSQLRIGQNYTFEDLRSAPSILVGAFNNKWSMQLTSNLRYRFDESNPTDGSIMDSASRGRAWRETFDAKGRMINDFGLVTRLIDSKTGQFTVTIGGLAAEGTQAATELISNPAYSHEFLRDAPADWDKKNMEIVIQTTVTGTVASPPHVVATHFW
jgi:hypothetical protein